MKKILFGAGCFWGVQHYFDHVPGVIESTAGYSGGHTVNPTYEDVCTGKTGHAEVVQLQYDPAVVSLNTLLEHFFAIHDPTQINRQGPDIGEQDRSVVFYEDKTQLEQINTAIQSQQKQYSAPIVTSVRPIDAFYAAEEYHQKYTQKTGRGGCHVAYQPRG